MYKVVFIRHGQSVLNMENRFAGWTDKNNGLSEKGVAEAHKASKLLMEGGYTFDIAFTSVLRRAIQTLWIVQDEMDLMWIPVEKSWRLNERHYGALQGLNRIETVKKFGEEQVHKWRRSYDIQPPALEKGDPRSSDNDPKYRGLDPRDIPKTECLKDTLARTWPYWKDSIVPAITAGKKVLVSAHGNSIRAIIKQLDNVPDAEIAELTIPTGIPLVYELDEKLKPTRHYYLGNQEDIQKGIEAIKNMTKVTK